MVNTDWIEVPIFVSMILYYILLIYMIIKAKKKRKEIILNQMYLWLWLLVMLPLLSMEIFGIERLIDKDIRRLAMFGSTLYLVVSSIGKLITKYFYCWKR